MDETTKRQLSFWLLILLPLMAWIGAAKATGLIEQGHMFAGVWHTMQATSSTPILMAAPIGAFLLAILLIVLLFRISQGDFAGARYSKFLRGSVLTSAPTLAKKTVEKNVKQIMVAGVPMPTKIENLHLLVAGSTGAGKSVLMRFMLWCGLMRGDRLIVTDPDGDLLAKFYQPGDVILNPYDARTAGWSPFNEVRQEFDYKALALSIVPTSASTDSEEWYGYGRLLLQETMKQLAKQGKPTMREVFQWTCVEPEDKLKKFLAGTLAESLFIGPGKAVESARFVLSDKLTEHVSMPEGDFSLRDWLSDPKGGNLWITWREDMGAALKPLISAWIDILCTANLSTRPNEEDRIWMFLDELASLDKIQSLERALTKGRKHGLRCVAGLQSTAQLDLIYGRDMAQTLRACFRSLAVLGGAKTDHKTAEDLSASIGDHEVEREQKSVNGGLNGNTSTSIRHERERVVLPSEITHLDDLCGFLAFSGDLPTARFKMTYQKFKDRFTPFEERGLIDA